MRIASSRGDVIINMRRVEFISTITNWGANDVMFDLTLNSGVTQTIKFANQNEANVAFNLISAEIRTLELEGR